MISGRVDGRLRSRSAILSILLLAAALRWADLGLVEYKYDEAHITGMALAIVRGGELPLLSGGTSLGVPRSAFDAWLLAAPLVFVPRPEAAVWLVAALGVVAVALTYALGSQVGGDRLGCLAALYMAANPWLVLYDRKLWAHIQIVFSVALLWLAWQVVVRGRRRAAFWFPILAVFQLMAHVLALVQAASWLAALVIAPRRWRQRWLAAGVAAAALLLLPYLLGLANWARLGLAKDGGSLAAAFPKLAESAESAAWLERWHSAWQVLGGAGAAGVAGLPSSANGWWVGGDWLGWLVLGLILAGLGRLFVWQRRPRRRQGAMLLLVWLAGPLLLLALGPMRLYPQYWTVLLPLPALLFALGLDAVTGRFSSRGGRALIGAVAAVIALVWAGAYFDLAAAIRAGAGAEAFGVPLSRWQQVLAEARSHAGQLGTDQVRVAVRGLDPGQQSDPAAVATLIGNPPFARFVAPTSPPALLLSAGRPSLYLWALDEAETEARLQTLGEMLWSGPMAAGLPPARIYQLPAAVPGDLGATPLDPPAVFDSGLSLVGYRLPDGAGADAPLEITLFWQALNPTEAARSGDFTAFNHVLDATTAEQVGQVDGLALLSRDWWPGDVLIQPYRLQLPAGSYLWRVGLYSRADGSRSQLLSGGDSVDLGPFVVGE